MNKNILLFLLVTVLALNACTPLATGTPTPPLVTATLTPLPGAEPTTSIETQVPTSVSQTEVNPSANPKQYTNNDFGFSFQFPSNWFGPSDYVSDETLRVEVGSDVVYPYGERPEQPSEVKNSYDVVLQYTKNNQNAYFKDTYQSLLNLKDGESLSDARSLLVRVRQLNIGRFTGFEYITTLSEAAQTEPVYIRSIMLVDEQTNDLVTIMGQPYNVEVSNGAKWLDVYRAIDEANLTYFHEIVDSITIK
jgi:hypothetical protein